MIQFGTIKFGRFLRTILVSSCGLKIKTHYKSRVSLHEAPAKMHKRQSVDRRPGKRGLVTLHLCFLKIVH